MKNEEAVSPLVGVIMMIAITVILAAVVASFVFGTAGEQKQQHFATVKAEHTATGGISLTLYNQDNQQTLKVMNVKINGVAVANFTPSRVGESKVYTGPFAGKGNHVYVDALFNDGTDIVVLDTLV